MTSRQAVRAIVLNDDKMLAMRRNKFGQVYYTLVGGGIEEGEGQETALRRELHEETGLEVGSARLVFIEDGGTPYGLQYVYLCEYKGGNPVLRADSEEAQSSALSENVYEPLWLSLGDVSKVPFRSSSVAEAVLEGVRSGFPKTPRKLAWKPETVTK